MAAVLRRFTGRCMERSISPDPLRVWAGVGQPASCGGEGDSAIGRLPDDMTADDAEAAQINTLHIDIPVAEEARVARRL